jgi:hypothetical protein
MRYYFVLVFLIILSSGLRADENKVPSWKKALPGTRAYLSDDSGGLHRLAYNYTVSSQSGG